MENTWHCSIDEQSAKKNQELKAVLLEETPWVLQAKSEQEQKKEYCTTIRYDKDE